MCPGSSGIDEFISTCYFDELNLGRISQVLVQNPDGIFDPPLNGVEYCRFFVSQEISNLEPDIISCDGDNTFEVKIKLVNDASPKTDMIVELAVTNNLALNSNPAQIFIAENGWDYVESGGSLYFRKVGISFNAGETKEFTVRGQITSQLSVDVANISARARLTNGNFPNTATNFVEGVTIAITPRYSTPIASDFETVYLSDLIDNGDIPASGAGILNDWMIEGTLIIDENYTIGSPTDKVSMLSMDVFSKIVIKNASLTIKGVTLKNCQNGMWDGIEVQNGGFLIIDESKILNAINGVKSVPYSYVEVTNTDFFNNHVAIDIGAALPNSSNSILGPFFGNWIHSDGQLLWPHEGGRSYAGLIIRDNDISLGVLPPPNLTTHIEATTTRFEGLKNGILATNCNLLIQNSEYRDITDKAIDLNTGSLSMYNHGPYQTNLFNEVRYGINARNSKLYIIGQTFNDCRYGISSTLGTQAITTIEGNTFRRYKTVAIELRSVEKYQIHNNEMELSNNPVGRNAGIFLLNGFDEQALKSICKNRIVAENGNHGIVSYATSGLKMTDNYIVTGSKAISGIEFQGGSGCQIEDNRVNNFTSKNTGKGIFINGTYASTFGCNRVSKSQTGINFFGACENTDLKGSIISDSERGLTLGEWPNVGGTIISPQNHRGNEWDGTFGDVGSYFAGPVFQIPASRFFVDEGVNTDFNTNSNVSDWFRDVDDLNTSFICSSSPINGNCDLPGIVQEGPFETELDDQLAEGFTVPGFTTPTTNWILNRHLTHRISKGQSALNSGKQSSYLSNNATASFNSMEQVRKWMIPPAENTAFQNNLNEIVDNQEIIELKLIEISEAYSQWLGEEINDNQLESLVTLKKNEIATAKANKSISYAENQNVMQQRRANALALNNAINDLVLPSQNEKAINLILINGVQLTDYNTLESIAIQCPLDGGDAVYIARGLLYSLGHFPNYDDGITCNSKNRQIVDIPMPSNSITLFPNPADHSVTISGFNKKEGTELLFYNWTGTLVNRIVLEKDNFRKSIDTQKWPSGIYYYSTNEKDAVTKKLVISH